MTQYYGGCMGQCLGVHVALKTFPWQVPVWQAQVPT